MPYDTYDNSDCDMCRATGVKTYGMGGPDEPPYSGEDVMAACEKCLSHSLRNRHIVLGHLEDLPTDDAKAFISDLKALPTDNGMVRASAKRTIGIIRSLLKALQDERTRTFEDDED